MKYKIDQKVKYNDSIYTIVATKNDKIRFQEASPYTPIPNEEERPIKDYDYTIKNKFGKLSDIYENQIQEI